MTTLIGEAMADHRDDTNEIKYTTAAIKSELNLIKWVLTFNIGLSVTILWKVFT